MDISKGRHLDGDDVAAVAHFKNSCSCCCSFVSGDAESAGSESEERVKAADEQRQNFCLFALRAAVAKYTCFLAMRMQVQA